jgi:hypothetical protein
MFCNFTNKNYKYYIKNKYNLDNDNLLLNTLNNEKDNIINYIKLNSFNIIINEYNYNIEKYCNFHFVDKLRLLNNLKILNKTLLITWNNNKIIIKIQNINNIILIKIKIIIYILEYLNLKKQNFKIILVLSNLEKFTPNENSYINPEHINSGYYDPNINTIFIWRYEEFEKVIFHEFIHLINLDKHNNSVNLLINTCENAHNYFEAITDFWAIFYHLIYLSLILNIDIKLLLEIELSFIKNQAMKLNHFLNLNNWDKKILINKNIKQSTSAFSYLILKYLLFEYIINLKEFNINLINYIKNIDLQILINKIINKKFIQEKYNNHNSFRMTLLQLKY